jgi:hypothetical protein
MLRTARGPRPTDEFAGVPSGEAREATRQGSFGIVDRGPPETVKPRPNSVA